MSQTLPLIVTVMLAVPSATSCTKSQKDWGGESARSVSESGTKPAEAVGPLVSKVDAAESTSHITRHENSPPVADGAVPACGAVQSGRVNRLLPIGQQATSWCWAAATQMVLSAYGLTNRRPSQCALVQEFLKSKTPAQNFDCCKVDPPCPEGTNTQDPQWGLLDDDQCNQPGTPDFGDLLAEPAPLTAPGTALPWNELKNQIVAGSPIVAAWRWVPSEKVKTGHVVVAFGYEELAGTKWVRIVDPLSTTPCAPETRLITYEEYVEGYNHKHDVDQYAFKWKVRS